MRRIHIFLFSWLLLFASSAAAEPVTFQALLERSTASPDSMVRYGGEEPQFIELYIPAAANTPPPLIVYLHGGCWLNSFAVDHARGFAEGVRNAGFAVALVEYRRLDDEGGGWPGTLNDIERAIEALAGNQSGDYNAEQITLVGHSAGGHLALLASQPERNLPISAVVGLAAITDIAAYAAGESGCQQSAARFIASSPSDVEAMNPVANERHAEVILLRGENDTIVGREQLQLDNAQVIHIEEAGHFDVIHLGAPAFSLVLRVLQQLHSEYTPIVSEE
ncbi:MAG: alpha/beta hydrolase [Idiomarina sp.]|nr:alpha/beta hydrolase [Idiomarina sp.]